MTDVVAIMNPQTTGLQVSEVDIFATNNAAVSRGEALWVQFSGSVSTATALGLRGGMCGIAMDNYGVAVRGRYRVQGACQALVQSTSSTALTADARLAFFASKSLQLDVSVVDTRRYVAISADSGALTATPVLKNVVLMGPNGLGISGGAA